MSKDAVMNRLPKDTVLDFAGCLRKPPRLYVGMTLQHKGHVQALREACDTFDKLFDIADYEEPTVGAAADTDSATLTKGER